MREAPPALSQSATNPATAPCAPPPSRARSGVTQSDIFFPVDQVKLYIGMTPMQRKWYKDLLNRDVGNLNTLGGPDKMRLLNILMQLRKVGWLVRWSVRCPSVMSAINRMPPSGDFDVCCSMFGALMFL